jgi:hypothetical protein
MLGLEDVKNLGDSTGEFELNAVGAESRANG